MKRKQQQILLILIGAILFNGLFWNEKMAINTVLYDFFLLIVLLSLYPNARQSSTVRWLLAGHLICLAMIVVHNTLLSKLAFSITLLLLIAFVQYVHRSIWFAAGSVLQNVTFTVPGLMELIERTNAKSIRRKRLYKIIRLTLIPILLVFSFYLFYASGNSAFSELSSNFGKWLEKYLINFFDFFSWSRFFFFLAGIYITASLLIKSKPTYFSAKDLSGNDILVRIKKNAKDRRQENLYGIVTFIMGRFGKGIMALKNLYTVGIISLILLNLLLLVVNFLDISYIWFSFRPMEVSLYKVIHEGTNMLILSIILAIIILLAFFRGNLNFFARNKWLKRLANIWIIQNGILVVSVLLRDYYYIREAGLGRNRIGILFYLVLVVFGLLTVFWKIHRKKTIYYLFRVNGWAALALLVIASLVNWDVFIVEYNLKRKNTIVLPVQYMATLSDEVLPLLYENREELKRHENLMKVNGFWDYRDCDGCWLKRLEERVNNFKKDEIAYSWLSWNLSDASVSHYFNNHKLDN